MTLLSVVAPVYCEEDGLEEFCSRVMSVLERLEPPIDHELVLVDDGSDDRSLEIMYALAARDPRVRVVELSRNFGHQIAITAGVDHAFGDAVVVIDSDLQDPPEVIQAMVQEWRKGADVAYGVRTSRAGERGSKLLTARVFYRVMSFLSDTPIPVDAGDFRLMDRAVVDAIREIREENRYIRGLVSWVGFRQVPVPYERDPRYAGVTKFSMRKMVRFAADGITSFSERPLRLSLQLGMMITAVALLYAAWIVGGQLLFHNGAPGYASLMTAILFLGGVQLLSIGLLGEYLGRTYRETKRRPLYFVRKPRDLER